jgi:hypothetical protein
MSKISRSPERHTFQKEQYIERMKEKGEAVNEDYLAMYDSYAEQHDAKFQDPSSRIENMEYDLLTTDWILEKVRESDVYAQNLYASMCNRDFIKYDVMPILKNQRWSCSWRYAGGIVADMRQAGDYIDWYCSGMGEGLGNGDPEGTKGYIPEGVVTDEIKEDLKQLGWVPVEWDKD